MTLFFRDAARYDEPNFLPRRHVGAWLRLNPCPCDRAARLSYDGSFPLDVRRGLPFGFHNARAFDALV